jgi:uncharacterized delta-60 repeat protein
MKFRPIRVFVVIARTASAVTLSNTQIANASVPAPFDQEFGTNGVAELTLPNMESTTAVTDVVEDSSGRLLGLLEIDGSRVAVVRLLSNGSIDTTFGESGRSQIFELFQASMQVQGDGKILVAGYVPGNVLPEVFITRVTTTGVVDTSFGTNGSKRIGSFPGKMLSSSSKVLLRYDASNEVIYLGFHSLTALPIGNPYNTFTFMSMTQNGEFRYDWARDASREVVPWTGSGPSSSILLDMQVLGDGSLIAVGSSFNSNNDKQITLIKLTPYGWIDTDFDGPSGNGNGLVKVNFATETEAYMSAILPLGDGSFYLAGTAGTLYTGPHYYGMAKFASDGTPDLSFSSDGFVLTQLQGDINAFVAGIDLLQNGNVIFPVDVNNGTGYATFTPSGDVPTTSNCTTCLWNPSNNTVRTHNLLVNSVGNVLIVGINTTDRRFFAKLFTSSGHSDNSFQTPDVRFYFPRWSVDAFKTLPQADGSNIVLAYAENESGIQRGVIFKLTSAGVMDQQFGLGGYSYLSPIHEEQFFYLSDMAVQQDGKILIVGSADENNYQAAIVLWRLNSDGSTDNTFGTNGRAVTAEQTAYLYASNLIVQSNGKILLGVDRRENNYTLPWLYRYLSNGTLDASFTDTNGFQGGIQPTNNEGQGWGAGVFPAPNGALYFKGGTTINGDTHTFLMRLLADGSPDQSFNSNGRRTWNDSDSNSIDWINNLAIYDDGKVLLLGEEDEPSPVRSVLVRLNSDGSDDSTFNSTNSTGYSFFVLRDPSTTNYSSSNAMVLSGNSVLVAGGGSLDQFGRQRFSAVAKVGSNAALDASFGSGGVVLNASGNNSIFYDIAKLTNSTSLVTGYFRENGISTGVVMKVSHQMPPTTTAPTLLAPLNAAQYELTPTAFAVTGSFPDTVMSGSIHIILTTTENGGATRSITVTDRQSLNVTFDPLAPHAGILNNSWASAVTTIIAGTSDTTSRLPDGTYSVSITYRSAIGGPKATTSASSVVFRSKCAPGTFSATGFIPCTTAGSGSFQNLYGATTAINCPAGTYQPNTGAITCLDAAANHFVPVQGSPIQIPCSTGTHAPDVRATSCVALSQSNPNPPSTPTTAPPTPTTTLPPAVVASDEDIKLVVTVTQAAILKRMNVTVPSGSKVAMRTTSPKVCRVVKTRVQATSTGTCKISVTVTDKKKKKTTKSTSFRVT